MEHIVNALILGAGITVAWFATAAVQAWWKGRK